MKKIFALGTAAAVLSLTAIAASAAIAPESSDIAVAGETMTVDIVANEFTGTSTQFTVEAEGLTLVDYSKDGAGLFNDTKMRYAWASAEAPADGTVLLTLVFTVDAAADEEVSVKIVPDAGFETGIDADLYVATVVDPAGEVEDPQEPTEPEEPGLEEPTEPEEPTEEPTEPEEPTEDPANPETGIALAVVPAVLAGAAVVVAKKRK